MKDPWQLKFLKPSPSATDQKKKKHSTLQFKKQLDVKLHINRRCRERMCDGMIGGGGYRSAGRETDGGQRVGDVGGKKEMYRDGKIPTKFQLDM